MARYGRANIGVALVLMLMLSACAPTVLRHPGFGADCETFDADVDCVRVFYGANRRILTPSGAPAINAEVDVAEATGEDAGQLTLGRADIWLPRLIEHGGERARGETPYARGEAPEDVEEQERYVFITRITAAGRERFVSDLGDAVGDNRSNAILLFVHGFNVEFEPALIRSAQLAVDLGQDWRFDPGAPVLFSWPSQGRITAYEADGDLADAAVPHLRAFLDILVSDVNVQRINIVAHSMGNRVLTQALEDYAEEYLGRSNRREIEFRIILAAADVDRDVFDLVADRIADLEPNVTIYTSDADWALRVSRQVNRWLRRQQRSTFRRLGETNGNQPYIRSDPSYATVDATPVATELFGIGHGYYSDNPSILNDIRCALADVPADRRSLGRARYADEPNGQEYFLTVPDADTADDHCALRRQHFPISAGERARPPSPPPPPPPPPTPPPPPPVFFTIYYEADDDDVSASMAAIVDQAVTYAQAGANAFFDVSARTDTVGDEAANQALSERRAAAVRAALVARGVPNEAVRTNAYGETQLFTPTPDETAEPLNRRVDILVSIGN